LCDKPFLKFERLLETYVAFAPRGFTSFRMAIPIWLREKLFLKDLLPREVKRWAPRYPWEERLLCGEHHLSHAARAFCASPFERATILTMDGVGEWSTTSLAEGEGNRIRILRDGRSIRGDARSPTMQRMLNLKVKCRESFRPFAPSVLRERVADWFELDGDSPYMLLVADVAKGRRRAMLVEEQALFGIEKLNVPRSEIPAVTHVDYSARTQTVYRETNPHYHALLNAFEDLTGCPVIVNTSFNVHGEPIVWNPEDAFQCFMGTELETLGGVTACCGRRRRTRRCGATTAARSSRTSSLSDLTLSGPHEGVRKASYRLKGPVGGELPPRLLVPPALRTQYGHASEVPRQTDQRPLLARRFQTSAQELPIPQHRLDDPKHRLHLLLA
jgi:predicted NodU family carbamoyl transferase